ncbi:hypothetical protein TWF730_007510 [Orbilia blumenaviensis]|uniref:F-box domain-containing protein n=1 Tax=Orbilia blumenaviensis TaxID=1796055 RepID=A0AAV9V9S2_9PEZI
MAAASFTSLPTEIVHEILGHPDLNRLDLYHAILVCRSFYHIAKQYLPRDADIILRNNRPRKLISFLRRLLADPAFGRGITEVTLIWGYIHGSHWRQSGPPGENGKPQEDFKWTAGELEGLDKLAKKYSFHPRWVKSIEELQDPGSLLIPIICLLPELEELDMGTPTCDTALEGVHNDCLDSHFEEFLQRLIMDDKKGIREPEELQVGFPEAFKSLKAFTRGDSEDTDGFDIDKIVPVFLFPSIERIELNTFGGDFNLLTRFTESSYLCKVKHVTFFNVECEAIELATFFRFCEALEYVKVRFEWVDMGILEDEEDIEETFNIGVIQRVLMEEHKDTLKDAEVEVERNYWWFKRRKGKWKSGWKPSWWGNEDWGSGEED